jgi:hypothetical protein
VEVTAITIDDVIAEVDVAIASGALVGAGPGNSAAGRLGAGRNMLNAAQNVLNAGDAAGACAQLQQAYLRADGDPKPPDFVEGAAREELAEMISDLMDSLGCT